MLLSHIGVSIISKNVGVIIFEPDAIEAEIYFNCLMRKDCTVYFRMWISILALC